MNKYVYIYIQVLSLIIIIKKILKKTKLLLYKICTFIYGYIVPLYVKLLS